MTYVKDWAFAYNTAPTDQTTQTLQAASFLLQLKNFLVAGGWSVVSSCDSTQYATNGTDYWSTLSNLVWASSGVHSWIVLKSPAGLVAGLDGSYTGDQSRLWFSIDLLVTSAYVYTATFRWHNSNPTTGASTSVCPTSTNQVGYANQQFLKSTLSQTAYYHFARTSEGNFFAMTGYSGAGYTAFFLGLPPCTNVIKKPSNNYDYPYATFGYARWNDASGGALQTASNAYYYNGNISTRDLGMWAADLVGWCYDGAVGTLIQGFKGYVRKVYPSSIENVGANSSTLLLPYCIGQAFPSSGDAWTGSQVTSPIDLYCTTSGKTALIGQLADIYQSGQGCPQGSVDGTTVTQTMLGVYWLPSDVAPSL